MDDLNVLKKYIGEKIKSIEENNKLIEQKQQQVAKLEKIYSPLISGNYANIDKNYLRDCFDFIFEGEDVNLIIEKFYQSITIVSDDRFAKEPQKPVAEGYLNKINTLLLTNIEKLKENIMKIKSEADDKISEYEEYFDLIKDGKIVRHLNENELKRFFKFLNESSLDKNVILNLTVLFSKDSLDYAENLRKLKIVREELVNLFKEYGYDFEKFEKDDKDKLLSCGNINNIRGMLDVLAENSLRIDINNTSCKLAVIFINSNSTILSVIIKNIKDDVEKNRKQLVGISSGNLSVERIFSEYLDTPSMFIKGKRKYKRRNGGSNGPGPDGGKTDKDYVVPAFDKYVKNRELLLENGFDINLVVIKCKTVLSSTPEKLQRNFDCFEFYGIPKNVYNRTLYSLIASNPLSAIDQFIELGCYRYILSNFSYVIKRPDDLMFYRIVKAKQLGDPIYSERRTQNIEFLGKISNDSKNGYGINRSNKQEVVSQYIPSFNPMYDEVVNRDRNAGSIILASNNYFITAIEEYKVDDLRYDFNGVIISRFKVLRIYETLIKNRMAGTYNAILYAICKNSILTEEQYRNITACLDRTFGNLKGVARG